MAETGRNWYVLRAVSGKEVKVKEYIEAAQKQNAMLNEYVFQVLVPTEKHASLRNGKRVVKEKTSLPGYVFVEASLVGDVAHMLRFIPNIHKLLAGLKLATRASLLVFIAFIVFLIIFAILSSTIFGTIAPEYFGNPAISVYSIFRLFTVEGWYEFADTIANNASSGWGFFARVYFSVLMFLGGVIGLSLINSIFVDAMAEDNNDEVLEKLRRLEEKIDQLSKTPKE